MQFCVLDGEALAIHLGKALGDIPQVVNGGHNHPEGTGHPVAGQWVNCLPLGPAGHGSSPNKMGNNLNSSNLLEMAKTMVTIIF